jgi:hypothetical protein
MTSFTSTLSYRSHGCGWLTDLTHSLFDLRVYPRSVWRLLRAGALHSSSSLMTFNFVPDMVPVVAHLAGISRFLQPLFPRLGPVMAEARAYRQRLWPPRLVR